MIIIDCHRLSEFSKWWWFSFFALSPHEPPWNSEPFWPSCWGPWEAERLGSMARQHRIIMYETWEKDEPNNEKPWSLMHLVDVSNDVQTFQTFFSKQLAGGMSLEVLVGSKLAKHRRMRQPEIPEESHFDGIFIGCWWDFHVIFMGFWWDFHRMLMGFSCEFHRMLMGFS